MAKFQQHKVAAIEGVPNVSDGRIRVYTAEMPASLVAQFGVDRALDVEGGFQRPFDKARAKKIGTLMGGDEKRNIDPRPHVQGGLLAYADKSDVSYAPSTGTLTIRKPLRLLDGQTRAGGDAWAVENGKVKEYTETVKVVIGMTRDELVRTYLITNMTARKVPPQNVLLNIAMLRGTSNNRKSWVARIMQTLASDAPFTLQHDDEFTRIVSFATRDGGQLSAYTLYKAINFILPEDLNREGEETEREAIAYCREAFSLYASMYDDWGRTEDDKVVKHDAYGFTLLAAFARFYKAIYTSGVADAEGVVRRAWTKAGLDQGLPEASGSGERAALAIAAYAAGEANVGHIKLNVAA